MIELNKDGAVHVITMNSEPNVINPALIAALSEALASVANDSEGNCGIVLTGTGKTFCSGLDLPTLSGLTPEEQSAFGSNLLALLVQIMQLPVPVIAALNGHTFAGGVFLALACDFRVMREDRGWFCISEVDAGVPIGKPTMALLQAKIKSSVVYEAVLTGKRYGAAQAMAAGFVDATASSDQLLGTGVELANSMASKERSIFGNLKRELTADLMPYFQA